MTARTVAPPGWPRDLPPPYAQEFPERVTGWLLDRAPPEFRVVSVWRREPKALAAAVNHHAVAVLEGLRAAYSGARRELADAITPQALGDVLAALERAGSQAAATVREVGLVEEALSGRQWRAKL